MAMVEDTVGYINLELLLNAEMQRQSLVWRAAGLKVDDATGPQISDDIQGLFVKPEGAEDNDRVVVVKEEKEEEGTLRQPEPEESTDEQREVTRGMSVEVPAKEWGWNWAKKTYGPEWKSKTRKGVEGECDPIRKGKKLQPAHFVRFEGEETENEVERMLDTEILKWAVRERALAATFTRPVAEKEAAASGKFEDARAQEIAILVVPPTLNSFTSRLTPFMNPL
eukprot:g69814.t1